jgi:hypothetical protein
MISRMAKPEEVLVVENDQVSTLLNVFTSALTVGQSKLERLSAHGKFSQASHVH